MNKPYLILAAIITIILYTVCNVSTRKDKCNQISGQTAVDCLNINGKNCRQKSLEAYLKCRE